MDAYSKDLRVRVLADCDAGMPIEDVAAKFTVSTSWVRKVKRIRARTGDVGPIPQRTHHETKLDPHLPRLRQMVEERPDSSLQDLVERFAKEGVKTNSSAIYRALRRMKFSYKKKVLRAAEQKRPDVQKKRAEWAAQRLAVDARRLVFIDETSTRTDMTRRYGRAPVGERVVGYVPQSHWENVTFIAGLSVDGLVAPQTIDGSMTHDRFLEYVREVLIPALPPDAVVVLDNLKCHKRVDVRETLEAVGAEIRYLPPYSPDFNPIEQAFSKVKSILRAAAERTIEGLQRILATIPSHFAPNECLRYVKHCGYALAV